MRDRLYQEIEALALRRRMRSVLDFRGPDWWRERPGRRALRRVARRAGVSVRAVRRRIRKYQRQTVQARVLAAGEVIERAAGARTVLL